VQKAIEFRMAFVVATEIRKRDGHSNHEHE
jgi:hypothetical protein